MKSALLTSLAFHGHGGSEIATPWGLCRRGGASWSWTILRSPLLDVMEPDSSGYPTLRFFNEFAEIQKTGNRLPHWQQEKATYFLTFRLADSIPVSLLKEWLDERSHWLIDHPKPWSTETEAEYHKLFSARIDHYLDQGLGSCLLGDSANAATVANAFQHFDHARYLLHAWVIMPNHVHLLLSLGEAVDLGETVASWKRFSATKINQVDHGSGPVWQKDYFDRLIRVGIIS